MKKTTIRRKIFFNSLIIIALALIMFIVGFSEFNKSNEFIKQIIPLNQLAVDHVTFKGHFETFEHNLENYFIIGGEIYKDNIIEYFNNLFLDIELIKSNENNAVLIRRISRNLPCLEGKCLYFTK